VAAALARAEAARARGDADGAANGAGSSAGGDGSGGVSGADTAGSANGAGGTNGNGAGGAQGANGQGVDPVADALRRAEQALRDAKLAAEREAADRRGRVDTAGSNVKIEENERQQTLDGMLPMALDMDERGLFEFDRYELRNEVKSTLDLLAEKLKSAEYDRLVILGYTDRIGSDDYNRQLSDKRAWAVAGYLMDRGVPPHKLKVEGRGERDSVTGDEACEGLKRAEMIQCLQRDRRVEIAATVKEYSLRVQ
jgi:outer membrane protein OmpA-like peptidoglycan-associated protein